MAGIGSSFQGSLCSFQTSQPRVHQQVAKVCCDSVQQLAPALDYLHTLQISAEFLHGFGTGQVPGARRREEKAGGGGAGELHSSSSGTKLPLLAGAFVGRDDVLCPAGSAAVSSAVPWLCSGTWSIMTVGLLSAEAAPWQALRQPTLSSG